MREFQDQVLKELKSLKEKQDKIAKRQDEMAEKVVNSKYLETEVGRKGVFWSTGCRVPVQNFIQANIFFIQAVTPSTKIKYKIIEKII